MSKSYVGGCLCGALRYEFLTEPTTVYICHCTECQKVSSSAFGVSVRVGADEFSITQGESKSIETVADSGRTKVGFFCPECGIRINNKPTSGNFVVVKAGTLDNPNFFKPIAHIWTQSAQSWFPFADRLPTFKKAPKDIDELNRLWLNNNLEANQ
jgi:hypothetical protein